MGHSPLPEVWSNHCTLECTKAFTLSFSSIWEAIMWKIRPGEKGSEWSCVCLSRVCSACAPSLDCNGMELSQQILNKQAPKEHRSPAPDLLCPLRAFLQLGIDFFLPVRNPPPACLEESNDAGGKSLQLFSDASKGSAGRRITCNLVQCQRCSSNDDWVFLRPAEITEERTLGGLFGFSSLLPTPPQPDCYKRQWNIGATKETGRLTFFCFGAAVAAAKKISRRLLGFTEGFTDQLPAPALILHLLDNQHLNDCVMCLLN